VQRLIEVGEGQQRQLVPRFQVERKVEIDQREFCRLAATRELAEAEQRLGNPLLHRLDQRVRALALLERRDRRVEAGVVASLGGEAAVEAERLVDAAVARGK